MQSFESLLNQLATTSVLRAGQPVRVWLARRLAVEVAVGSVWTKVVLSRDGYPPTEDEFQRVIECWPRRPKFLTTPHVDQRGSTFFIATEWLSGPGNLEFRPEGTGTAADESRDGGEWSERP